MKIAKTKYRTIFGDRLTDKELKLQDICNEAITYEGDRLTYKELKLETTYWLCGKRGFVID